jgi:predicted RNA-binding Zn-ribbon protein involved in translation (DUF1610 family)
MGRQKVKIDEFDKTLVCPNCGWYGKLGDTRGPHQIKDAMITADKSRVVVKSIHNCHYCPNCFDEKTQRGTLVQYFVVYQNPKFKPEPPDTSPAGKILN